MRVVRETKRGNVEERTGLKREAKRKPSQIAFNPTVSIIGAGRLGAALAFALSAKGIAVETVICRSAQKARRVARLAGAQTQALLLTQLSDLPPSDVLLITTPDDVIEPVAQQVAVSIGWKGGGHVALHASGALSSDALESLRAAGFSTGSMHPLISVSDPIAGASSLGLAHFSIEGKPQAVRVARSLVRILGGQSFSISPRDKSLYHAAAVMSSGHVVALFDITTGLLIECGLTRLQARDALLPLLKSTVENLTLNPTSRALTGTFARADVATVVKHLAALRAGSDSDALAAYVLLGLHSLLLAPTSAADPNNARKIRRILKANSKL